MRRLIILLLLLCSIGVKAQSTKFRSGDSVLQARSSKHRYILFGRVHEPEYQVLVLDSVIMYKNYPLWYAHDMRGLFYDRVSEITIWKKNKKFNSTNR